MKRSKRHIFTIYHPGVIFLYFCGTIGLTMITLQPIYVGLSLLIGSLYAIYLYGIYRFLGKLLPMLLLFVIIAAINPLLQHQGNTVLFLMGNKPITMESVMYGLCSAGMLLSVMIWFTCYQFIMTNEKFLYLFGNIFPTVALMVSMVFKLIPETIKRARSIVRVQKALVSDGNKSVKGDRVTQGIHMASTLVSWSLENCIATADSMRSRGYGLKRRTSYKTFRLCPHDWLAVLAFAILISTNILLIILHANSFTFYPELTHDWGNPWMYALYSVFLLYPLLLEGREQLLWI